MRLLPVIMCGGAGSRLWPRSRSATPKQFLSLFGEASLLASTVHRLGLSDLGLDIADPVVICGLGQEALVEREMIAAGAHPGRIIVEPFGRDTASVAAIASLEAQAHGDETLVLLLPADHHIADEPGFWKAVEKGLPAARNDYLVTLGIDPTGPETGYGYIRRGNPIGEDVFAVSAFTEKPDAARAAAYLATGEYYWNAGIFLFRAGAMLSAFEAHAPEILIACRAAYGEASATGNHLRLDPVAFARAPSSPVDVAIMEQAARRAIVAPVRIGWNDVGSWAAIADIKPPADAAMPCPDVIEIDCKNTLIETDGVLVSAIGLEDIIIVATRDAILVTRKDRAQDVKAVVSLLKARGRTDIL